MNQLEVNGLSKRFGGLTANHNVDIYVAQGEIVGLIGPNGAGKTTLFNCVAGHYRPDGGSVVFDGREITGWTPDKICRAGVARTFQIVKSFGQMSVLDNVMVGAFLHNAGSGAARRVALQELEFTGMAEKKDMLARNLTIADRKRLELTRALATGPKFMMLDEVMAGLTPKETQEAVRLIKALHDRGITILLVEHVMEVVMPISDRIVVLESGQKIAEGAPTQIARDPRVIKAYLGEEYRASS